MLTASFATFGVVVISLISDSCLFLIVGICNGQANVTHNHVYLT